MPFRFPFGNPYYYNYNYKQSPSPFSSQIKPSSSNSTNNLKYNNYKEIKIEPSEDRHISEDSEYFFEIFGLRLHFDDVLIICILFFLYSEQVHDDELFLVLVLLLIS